MPPTGAYSVTFSLLSGYRTRTQENIVVKIDSTTGVELGKQGTNLNFEFVDEIQVKSGAYNAEFGRATGSVINVIIKSGGDEFHGDLFDYFDSDSRQAGLSGAADAGAIGASFKQNSFSRSDFGILPRWHADHGNGCSDLCSNWEYDLSERGAIGRVDSQWEADLRFGYPIKLGLVWELNLMLDIFNVFNKQGEPRATSDTRPPMTFKTSPTGIATFRTTRSRPMIPTVRRLMKVGTPPYLGRTRPPFVSACACPSNPAFIASTRRAFGPSLLVPRRPG